MKSTRLLMTALAGLVLSQSNQAFASGMTSNGGEIITYQHNPWFVNRDKVTYCFEKAPQYSIDLAKAKFEVQYAIDDWQRTLSTIEQEPDWGNGPVRIDLAKPTKYRYAKTFQFVERCTDETDLTILLGVINDDVREVIDHSGHGFVGFSKRQQYDEQSGWSKGYIWIAPDTGPDSYKGTDKPAWGKGSFTYYILLHELGHVMGIEHSENIHIMKYTWPENLADRFSDPNRGPNDDANIYSLPDGYKFHLSRSVLFQSFPTQEVRACQSISKSHDSASEYEKQYDNFIMNLFGLSSLPDGTANSTGHRLCLTPDLTLKTWNLSLYDKHPIDPSAHLLKGIVLPTTRADTGSSLSFGKYKVGDLWKVNSIARKWQAESRHQSAMIGGRLRHYNVATDDNKVVMSFVYEGRVMNLDFRLHDADFVIKETPSLSN